ncbi:Scr1 family TA system antitoxin-like transcriptional regulator [Saccharothrix xinjiangensis]|uniref:Scr1 family TA system antitoxin-like transcriptional regulator n=1 Tax=Saccharothrix xinjiangensis TaxID=204798 RepID=A0ABV9XZP4_9PSEU
MNTKNEGFELVDVRISDAFSRDLGATLRQIRTESGARFGDLLEALEWSAGKLSKLERGTRGASDRDIFLLLGHLQANKDQRARVEEALATPARSGFVRRHERGGASSGLLAHEHMAQVVTVYETVTVPTTARTWEYARELTESEELATQQAKRATQARTRITASLPQRWVYYLHELALHAVVGGPKVMRDQLLNLVMLTNTHNTVVRIVPLSVPMDGDLQYPGTFMSMGPGAKRVVVVEGDTATAFHDDAGSLEAFQARMDKLDEVALDVDGSRAVLARWADSYDQRIPRDNTDSER